MHVKNKYKYLLERKRNIRLNLGHMISKNRLAKMRCPMHDVTPFAFAHVGVTDSHQALLTTREECIISSRRPTFVSFALCDML